MSPQNRDDKYQDGPIPAPNGLADDVIISADTLRQQRVPPGQCRTRKWPVLDAFGTPRIDLNSWRLKVWGLVDTPLSLDLEQFQTLPRIRVFADFHCVTRWSRLGNLWEGVSTRSLLDRAGVSNRAKFAILHAYDNSWSTNLPLEDFVAKDAMLALSHDGQPISADHGGPVRGVVPSLYAWKSAKWICGVELSATDKPGYWERGGYHNHGDPWVINENHSDGERFSQ